MAHPRPFTSVYSTPFFSVQADSPASGQTPYYRIVSQDSVIIAVLDPSDNLMMVRQYRPNLSCYTLETPAGGIEGNETPALAAERELREELGITASLLPLGNYFRLMMNRTTIKDYLYFAMHPKSIPSLHPEEGIEIIHIPRTEIFHLALSGSYTQLAGIGLLQLASATLSVDLQSAGYNTILQAFDSHPDVICHSKNQ